MVQHGGGYLRGRDGGQVGTAIAASALRAMTDRAVLRKDALAGRGIANQLGYGCGRLRLFARMEDGVPTFARRHLAQLAVQREQPEIVAVRRGGQCIAAGVERHELLALVLEHGGHAVGACAGLELPQVLAGCGFVGVQLTRVGADEDQIAGGDNRA